MRTDTRNMILAALMAALTAIGAFLQIPLGITSITLQVLFTCLAGLLLGPRWGAISQIVYVVLGLVGLPVFTQGGGLGYLVKPSMGFLFGLIAEAWVVGMLTRKKHGPVRVALACAAGVAAMYAVAVPYMYLVLNLYMGNEMSFWTVVETGMLLYLPGDAIKIVIIIIVSAPLFRAIRRDDA